MRIAAFMLVLLSASPLAAQFRDGVVGELAREEMRAALRAGLEESRLSASLRRLSREYRRSRAGGRPLDIRPDDARTLWDALMLAGYTLWTLDVQPADANHAVRNWDSRFESFLSALSRVPLRYGRFGSRECEDIEVHALLSSMNVATVRNEVFRRDGRGLLWAALAQSRTTADEARRRRRDGLSCEDMSLSSQVPLALGASAPGLEVNLLHGLIAMFGLDEGSERWAAIKRREIDIIFARIAAEMTPERAASLVEAGSDALLGLGEPHCSSRLVDNAGWRMVGFSIGPTVHRYRVEPASGQSLWLSAMESTACERMHETRRVLLNTEGRRHLPEEVPEPASEEVPEVGPLEDLMLRSF